jgi:lactoylglutathione lyase
MDVGDWDWTQRIFDHVEVRATDYDESVRFYETVLAAVGIPKLVVYEDEHERWTGFANLNVVDRQPPTQNLHICLRAHARSEVERFHELGVAAGFRSNGAPGYREYGPGYYAAFLLDPDDNNVEALYRDVGNIGHEG